MKKKLINFIVLIFIIFIRINLVNAEDLVCSYHVYDQNIDLNVSSKKIIVNGELIDNNQTPGNKELYYYSVSSVQEYIEKMDGLDKCFSLYACYKTVSSEGPGMSLNWYHYYYFFPSEYEYEDYMKKRKLSGDHSDLGNCDFFPELNSGSTEKKCPGFEYLEKDLNDKVSEYGNCEQANSCKDKITEINSIFNQFKSFCNSILQYSNYDSKCVENCISLNDTLKKYRGDTNLSGDCGFSDRLINWVINIFKWIKYILPVIVIILGIIDFIKAIGSEKEDEMKKSQGRFVKRLIAAALVFIVPFIIEFILEKLGFSSNSCGLW